MVRISRLRFSPGLLPEPRSFHVSFQDELNFLRTFAKNFILPPLPSGRD